MQVPASTLEATPTDHMPKAARPAHFSNPENTPMRPTTILATAASCAISMTTLAAPHTHAVSIDASRASLTNANSFSQVHLGDTVEMTVALQDGTPVSLELERFSPFTKDARVVSVDAKGNEHTIDLSSDVHLRGHVEGDESQIVYISVTQFGTSGFLEIANETHVISTGKYSNAQKSADDLTIFPADLLNIEPVGQNCAVDINNPMFNPHGLQANDEFVTIDDPQAPLGTPPQRQAQIIVETDYEFSSWLFGGNTTASASYATSLIAASSTIYDRDVNMTLAIPFLRTYEVNNDPYGGSDIIDFLNDVQNEFNTGDEANIDRTNVHGLSARSLGGGVAYFPSTCDDFESIGVSANLDGFFPNPLQDNSSNNWDIIVFSHEMGHNFGSGHTHDSYSPVIDGCGNGDCSQALDATIMSYCHLCPGGLSNIDLRFHTRVQNAILDYLENVAPCDLTVSECAVDLNGDGALDFFDISAFLTLFNASNPAADWNDDGSFDFFDISAYLTAFNTGCP